MPRPKVHGAPGVVHGGGAVLVAFRDLASKAWSAADESEVRSKGFDHVDSMTPVPQGCMPLSAAYVKLFPRGHSPSRFPIENDRFTSPSIPRFGEMPPPGTLADRVLELAVQRDSLWDILNAFVGILERVNFLAGAMAAWTRRVTEIRHQRRNEFVDAVGDQMRAAKRRCIALEKRLVKESLRPAIVAWRAGVVLSQERFSRFEAIVWGCEQRTAMSNIQNLSESFQSWRHLIRGTDRICAAEANVAASAHAMETGGTGCTPGPPRAFSPQCFHSPQAERRFSAPSHLTSSDSTLPPAHSLRSQNAPGSPKSICRRQAPAPRPPQQIRGKPSFALSSRQHLISATSAARNARSCKGAAVATPLLAEPLGSTSGLSGKKTCPKTLAKPTGGADSPLVPRREKMRRASDASPHSGDLGRPPERGPAASDGENCGQEQSSVAQSPSGDVTREIRDLRRGPERFFYDTQSYTGCARVSLREPKVNFCEERRHPGEKTTAGAVSSICEENGATYQT